MFDFLHESRPVVFVRPGMEQPDPSSLKTTLQTSVIPVQELLLEVVLKTAGLLGSVLTYGQAAALSGFGQAKSSLFHSATQKVLVEDLDSGRPIRASVLVSKKDGLPDDDYFLITCGREGLSDPEKKEIHEQHLSRLRSSLTR